MGMLLILENAVQTCPDSNKGTPLGHPIDNNYLS